jgi:uncharacterized protein
MYLPDVNFWLALAFNAKAEHATAKTWFDALGNQQLCLFCRSTQQGVLRLATNAKAVGPQVCSMIDAWNIYDQLLMDSRIAFATEPTDIEIHWRAMTQRRTSSLKLWNDAFLAAFAANAGLELVTFDQAFTQFAGIRCSIL